MADDYPASQAKGGLESREPTPEDLAALARSLNALDARYIVIGGFAIRAAGYDRRTMDIDLLIDTSLENEARVLKALEILPDKAAREVQPGEVSQYAVVRIADEIVVDLMKGAGPIGYEAACHEIEIHHVHGVPIPFASPRLLLRMKTGTHREKDAIDVVFLEQLLARQ